MRRRNAVGAAALLTALIGLACGDDGLVLPAEGEPAELEIVGGNEQSGVAGQPLPDPITVEVTDSRDRPVVDQRVVFTVVGETGGDVVPDTVLTGADGRASAEWVLGPAAGMQEVEVHLVGGGPAAARLRATFTASVGAGSAATLAPVSGDGQTGVAGTPLSDPLVVQVTDEEENPVAGVEVQWSVTGGGTASAPVTETGDDGLASVTRTLGPTPGTQTTVASVEGIEGSVTFEATATVGEAGRLAIVTQPSSTAQSGVPFAQQPAVQLLDANGNPVPGSGTAVQASIASGPAGATLIGSTTAATDDNGVATFSGLGLSGPAGTYRLNFSGVGIAGVISGDITIGAGSAGRLEITTQPAATAQSGEPLDPQPSVRLVDASGNPVGQGGVQVSATIASGGGTLGGNTTVETNAEGVAQFTDLVITGSPGARTLIFAAANVTSVTSDPINVGSGAVSPSQSSVDASATGLPTGGTATITVTVRDAAGSAIQGASVSLSSSGSGNTITPATAASGSDGTAAFTFSSTVAEAKTITATANGVTLDEQATITVTAVNQAPTAADDAYSTEEGTALNVPAPGVLENDSDPDDNPLTAVKDTDPTSGTVSLNADGSFVYTPNPGFSGTDAFTYHVSDGTADSEAATVTITVSGVNQPPTAADDGGYSTSEGTPLTVPAPGVLGNDADADGDPLTAATETNPDNGSLVLSEDGSFTYTPNPGFSGTDAFTYRATDGTASSEPATVTITVNSVNAAPTGADDAYEVNEDTPLSVVVPGVLSNDSDSDGDRLRAEFEDNAQHGAVVGTFNGSFIYIPEGDFNGSDAFTYTASDGTASSAPATVTITVRPVNDPPIFTAGPNQNDNSVTIGSGPQVVPGWATDIRAGPDNEAGQVLQFAVDNNRHDLFSAQPAVDPTGTLTYTPADQGDGGTAEVSVALHDDGGTADGGEDQSAAETFTIRIRDGPRGRNGDGDNDGNGGGTDGGGDDDVTAGSRRGRGR